MLATNLAAMASRAGRQVMLVDSDPQGTGHMWSLLRREIPKIPPVPCLRMNAKEMQTSLSQLAQKADEVIIDAGGRDSLELRTGLVMAQVVVVPFKPSQFDVWALERMSEMIARVLELNPALRGLAVINQASTNPKVRETVQARDFFPGNQAFRLAGSVLRDRVAYGRAASEGLAVVEQSPGDAKATSEMEELFAEVFHG
jgi:chromosome partitioning protein